MQRAGERFGRDVHAAGGEGLGGYGRDDAGEEYGVAGNRGCEFLGLERSNETLGHRRPCCKIPLDWDDHGAVIGPADGAALPAPQKLRSSTRVEAGGYRLIVTRCASSPYTTFDNISTEWWPAHYRGSGVSCGFEP
jgi:hypothetical protein